MPGLDCVPLSRFIEPSQTFEYLPGFGIELIFRSRSRSRKQHEWMRTLKLNSQQDAPLNLALAEDLTWRASRVVTDALDSKRDEFYADHRECEWLEGIVSCQHFDEDALDIQLRVFNSLGPDFEHLHRMIRSRLGLFRHPDGTDCSQFMMQVTGRLGEARDTTDNQLSRMDDFDLRIRTLQGRGWRMDNVARFRKDYLSAYTRRTIQAILDRVQTGIADVLRGNDIAIHVNAYKRGHLVLDKAIIAHVEVGQPPETFASPEAQRVEFVARLKARIEHDLDMIYKDTCSLDDILDVPEPVVAEGGEPVLASEEEHERESVVELPAETLDPMMGLPRTPSPGPRTFPLMPEDYTRGIGSEGSLC